VVALLLSQEAVAETQQTGTPLSNPTTRAAQAGQASKLTPEQEAALVEVRKILKEAWEVADQIEMPSPLFTKKVTIKALGEVKQILLSGIIGAQLQAGYFPNSVSNYNHLDVVIAQIRYGHLEDAVKTATSTTLSPAETLVILKLLSDAGDLDGAMQVAEAQVRPGTGRGGPPRRQYEAELMAYVARRQAQAKNPEARETMRRAEYAVRTNKNFQRFQFGGAAALGCAKAAMGDLTAGAESFRQAINAAASITQEEYEVEKASAVTLIGRAAAESGLKTVSLEAFQEALRLARNIAQPADRAKAMANVAISQSSSGDRLSGQRTLEEAIHFAESMSDPQERRRARGAIAGRQIEAGERENAKASIERMQEFTEGIADVNERERDRRNWELRAVDLMTIQEALDRAYALQGNDEQQAAALASTAYKLIHSPEPVGTPEMLQRMSQLAEALLTKPVPTDRQKADRFLGDLAVVQAVTLGAPQALETARRLTDAGQKRLYLNLLSLLTQKKDVAGAKQMAALLREEWLPWDGTGRAFAELGKAIGVSEDLSRSLTWARAQKNLYVQAEALLGVALGIMEREGIYNLRQQLPASMAINKGARDTLTLGCANL
jgi:tetratricopeptide (TPR) repeat protein